MFCILECTSLWYVLSGSPESSLRLINEFCHSQTIPPEIKVKVTWLVSGFHLFVTSANHPPLVSPFFVIILAGTWTAALRCPHLMTSNAEHGLCCSCFVHQLSSRCLIVVLLYLCCLEIPESNFIYTPAVFACGSAFRRSCPYVGCCASVHRRGITVVQSAAVVIGSRYYDGHFHQGMCHSSRWLRPRLC